MAEAHGDAAAGDVIGVVDVQRVTQRALHGVQMVLALLLEIELVLLRRRRVHHELLRTVEGHAVHARRGTRQPGDAAAVLDQTLLDESDDVAPGFAFTDAGDGLQADLRAEGWVGCMERTRCAHADQGEADGRCHHRGFDEAH